jgi:hypothetical protein
LKVIDQIQTPDGFSHLQDIDPWETWGLSIHEYTMIAADQQDEERRFKLVRRFVDKAGVVKLTTKAMWRLGTQFGQVSSALMGDAMIEALCMVLKYPDHVDLFNNAPPPRVLLENYDLQHVIIPRQFCQSQVYRQRINPGGSPSHADAVWIPREGSSVEKEQRKAVAAYSGDDVISYSDSDSDEAFFLTKIADIGLLLMIVHEPLGSDDVTPCEFGGVVVP